MQGKRPSHGDRPFLNADANCGPGGMTWSAYDGSREKLRAECKSSRLEGRCFGEGLKVT